MKLVLADCGATLGGGQRNLWELATRLPKDRFDLVVWIASAPALDPLAEALDSRDVRVDRIPSLSSPWNWRGFLGLRLKLRRTQPTLLHLHDSCASERITQTLAESAAETRLIVTTSTGRGLDAGALSRRRRLLERADLITVSSQAAGEFWVQNAGIDRDRVRAIPPGTELPDEVDEGIEASKLRDRFGATPLRPLWVCPGRLEPGRGQHVFLDALATVKRRGLAFAGVVAGEGPDRAALEARVREHRLEDSVHVVDVNDEFAGLLAAADAVVLTALEESPSDIVLAAMARGCTVVASATPGHHERIDDGIDGCLVAPGDEGALAQSLEMLYRRGDSARRLGSEAALRAREEFTWPAVVRSFEAIYDEALGLATFESMHAHAGW